MCATATGLEALSVPTGTTGGLNYLLQLQATRVATGKTFGALHES